MLVIFSYQWIISASYYFLFFMFVMQISYRISGTPRVKPMYSYLERRMTSNFNYDVSSSLHLVKKILVDTIQCTTRREAVRTQMKICFLVDGVKLFVSLQIDAPQQLLHRGIPLTYAVQHCCRCFAGINS